MVPRELDVLTAAALGALQGIAEFLPISSSGHLALCQAFLGIDAEAAGHSFNIIVHAGTLLAVLVVYGRELLAMARSLVGVPRETAPSDERSSSTTASVITPAISRETIVTIVLACLPLGVFLIPGVEELVIAMESEVRLVGIALLVTAAMLFLSHRAIPPVDDPMLPPTRRNAILVGLAQCIAVLPGISRSGTTIAAGLALGMGRARAARFSFLLSIPAVLGASSKEGLDLLLGSDAAFDPLPFAVGFVVSFLTGLVALRGLLRFIERFGMLPFVPYLLIVGTVAIIFGGPIGSQ